MNANRIRAMERTLSKMQNGTCEQCREFNAMSDEALDAEIVELERQIRTFGGAPLHATASPAGKGCR